MDLRNSISAAENEIDKKGLSKSENIEGSTDSSTLHGEVKTSRDEDQKYLTSLITTCQQKSADFKSRQTLRAEEIVAVEKAIEIISGGAVSGNADKHLPAMLQTSSSFAQLRADLNTQAQARVAKYLQSRSKQLNSRVLSMVAQRASEDPFTKVQKMIKGLITRLMEEANEEAEHKGWCDTELSTNEQTRKEKTEAVETLHAEIDQLKASIAKLTEDITELTKAVAELDAAMSK